MLALLRNVLLHALVSCEARACAKQLDGCCVWIHRLTFLDIDADRFRNLDDGALVGHFLWRELNGARKRRILLCEVLRNV